MKTLAVIFKWLYQIAGAEMALFLILLLAISCAFRPGSSDSTADLQQARQALANYLQALNEEDYPTAAGLYGGSTQFLQEANPELDPADTAQLLRNGCLLNGLQCLPIYALGDGQVIAEGIYAFDVQFNTPEGRRFERGPCCGATETEMPTQSIFSFRVQQHGDRYLVLDLPPYVP